MENYLKDKPADCKRLTIGYLDENGNDEYHSHITEGIIEAAKKHDVNIIRFGHFTSNATHKHDLHISMILEYIEQFKLDGLIFLGWARAVSLENHESFKKRFSAFPLFSLGSGFPDIPSAYFPGDNYTRELLLHLVKVHNYRKIAFIAPFWPDRRSEVYAETMQEYGIYDPNLYVSEQELINIEVPQRGKKAVSILLDDRKVEIDAIVSLFNAETEGILNELNSRGINVPGDIALTSYEDGEIGKYISPAFTTVRFPWWELGYCACEKIIEKIKKGTVSMSIAVPGEFIIRDSCGCRPASIQSAEVVDKGSAIPFTELNETDLDKIVLRISGKTNCGKLDIGLLMRSLYHDLKNLDGNRFLFEMETQLLAIPNIIFPGLEEFVTIIRNEVVPYLLNAKDTLLFAEDIFLQAQNLIRERLTCAWSYKERQLRQINDNLQEIGYFLMNNFSLKGLMDSLEINLPKLNIPSCYIFMFNDKNMKISIFDNSNLVFEYADGKRVKSKTKKTCSTKQKLSEILSGRSEKFAMMANLLHVGNEFLGFVLYEPGPKDERVYQALSTHISTVLSVAILLEKLDNNYKKLIEQAHKEGMFNIATGILHNIRNVINSTTASTHLMRDLMKESCLDDFLKSVKLLEENIGNLETFLANDAKGMLLLKYFIKLGEQIEELQGKLIYQIGRLSEKADLVDDALTAQQSFISVKSMMEESDVTEIIENAIIMNQTLLDQLKVEVRKEYCDNPIIRIQKIKLFQILSNLIKNAVEAMKDNANTRTLVIIVNRVNGVTFIMVGDNGCGIEKDKLKSIFTYGYTTKKEGHGFGLHSCANYAAEMGGKIWAESNGPGKGSTFILKLVNS